MKAGSVITRCGVSEAGCPWQSRECFGTLRRNVFIRGPGTNLYLFKIWKVTNILSVMYLCSRLSFSSDAFISAKRSRGSLGFPLFSYSVYSYRLSCLRPGNSHVSFIISCALSQHVNIRIAWQLGGCTQHRLCWADSVLTVRSFISQKCWHCRP